MLSAILFEVPAEIRVDDLSDIPLDSLAELLAAFETPGINCDIGAKISGGSTMGTVKKETREIGGLVFFTPFELGESDKGIPSPACGIVVFAVETAGTLATLALTGSSERYKAHMAEKIPAVPNAGLVPPIEARGEGEATFGFADWMAVVTIRFRVDGKLRTQSTWMHLMRQPAAVRRDEEGGAEQEWNQANPNDADGRQEDCNER